MDFHDSGEHTGKGAELANHGYYCACGRFYKNTASVRAPMHQQKKVQNLRKFSLYCVGVSQAKKVFYGSIQFFVYRSGRTGSTFWLDGGAMRRGQSGTFGVMGAAILLFGTAPAVYAESLSISNPSFEQTILSSGNFDTNIAGWSKSGSAAAGILNPDAAAFVGGFAPHGENIAWINAADTLVSQTLSATLAANTTYSLSMQVGNRADSPSFPGFSIELLAGGQAIASLIGAADSVPDGQWALKTLPYTLLTEHQSLVGQPLGIRFGSQNVQTVFDDVQLVAVVPEPSTLALGALGSLFLLRRRGRTRSA